MPPWKISTPSRQNGNAAPLLPFSCWALPGCQCHSRLWLQLWWIDDNKQNYIRCKDPPTPHEQNTTLGWTSILCLTSEKKEPLRFMWTTAVYWYTPQSIVLLNLRWDIMQRAVYFLFSFASCSLYFLI